MRPIDASLIRVPLRGPTKAEAIGELLDLMDAQGLIQDRDGLFQQLLAREAKRSTAIGLGAAIPHVRSEFVQDTVCAFGCACEQPIDFSNEGEEPIATRILFLMISPKDDAPNHLKALAKIARLVKDDARRESLGEARDTERILELLGELATSPPKQAEA